MSKLRFSRLDDDVRALVRRAATIEAAPAGAKARVLAGVQALAASSRGDGDGHAGATGDESPPPPIHGAPFVGRALAVAGAFALGGAFGAFVMYRAMHMQASLEATHVAPIERDVPTAPAYAPAAPQATPSAQPGEPTRAVSAVSALPVESATSTARQRPVPTASTSSRKASSIDALDALADERTLLDRARGAIEREDGAAALAATAEHARKYPGGVLVQEREAIAVRALVLLGRTDEARASVARFRERFPDSLLLPALESSAGMEPMP
jgi:hypothetical protein